MQAFMRSLEIPTFDKNVKVKFQLFAEDGWEKGLANYGFMAYFFEYFMTEKNAKKLHDKILNYSEETGEGRFEKLRDYLDTLVESIT